MSAHYNDHEFHYRATNTVGVITNGVVSAARKSDAIALLARRGLLVVKLEQSSQPRSVHRSARVLSLADASTGLQALAELLSAGLPIARALAALPELAPNSWSKLQPSLLRSVTDGRSLSDAFAQAPVRIPKIALGLIAAGEESGRIAPSVRHAASILESQNAQRSAMANALAYPTFLAAIGTTTVTLLIVFVFPRMAQLLADLGQQIPDSTRALIAIGDFISQWALVIATAFVLATLAVRQLLKQPKYLLVLHRALLRVPILGEVRHSSATSRLCISMSAMLAEGLPMSRVLTMVDQVVGDEELRVRLRATHELVTGGQSLAAAVSSTALVTRPAARMIAAGEMAGSLADMLSNASKVELMRAERLLRIITKFSEPALVLILGGAVMFVAAALLQAVYAITPSVQ